MVNITSNIPTSSAALGGGSTHAPYGRVTSNTNRNIDRDGWRTGIFKIIATICPRMNPAVLKFDPIFKLFHKWFQLAIASERAPTTGTVTGDTWLDFRV